MTYMIASALAGMALLCWPMAAVRLPDWTLGERRRDALRPAAPMSTRGSETRPSDRWGPVLGAASAAAASGLALGWAPGIACGLLTHTAVGLGRKARLERRNRAERAAVVQGVRALAREVRNGATPQAACAALLAATSSAPASGSFPGTHRVSAQQALLAQLSAALPLPDPVAWWAARHRAPPTGSQPEAAALARLIAGWELTRRHGVAWSLSLDACVTELSEDMRAAAARSAAVAGPRFSGYVLAAMPVLGIGLGIGMGADPVHVLLGTGTGAVLLVAGTGLTCVGIRWAARIVRV